MSMTDALDVRIRELVAELIESSPPAPTLADFDWSDSGESTEPQGRPHKPGRRHLSLLTGGVTAAVVAILVVVLMLSSIGQHQAVAAAAELRQIASNAAGQPVPQLSQGQWLLTEQNVSFLADVTQLGSKPTPDAQATVSADIKQWSNGGGDTCISARSGPAQFASPTNQAAWTAAGLLDDPVGQPVTSCVTVSGLATSDSPNGGAGVIDASSLPTDPSTLARELSTGTTGIAALDQLQMDQGRSAGLSAPRPC